MTEIRDPLLWPFSSDSIWNMPIGSDAIYEPANFKPLSAGVGVDVDYFFVSEQSDPEVDIYAPASWCPRAGGDRQDGRLYLGDDVLIPDCDPPHTPNNCAAILQPDGRTLVQLGAMTRLEPGGPVWGYRYPDVDICGPGIEGAHGGSGLSSIGGTLRKDELTGADPIRHVLKMNVFARLYLYKEPPGFRWPAVKADGYAFDENSQIRYGGENPKLQMGALVAIPPEVKEADLNLFSDRAKKLFNALQDYGAYIVDDTAWGSYAFEVEAGAERDLPSATELNQLIQLLQIVDNNGPDSIGGGGKPRVPYAPPLGTPCGE